MFVNNLHVVNLGNKVDKKFVSFKISDFIKNASKRYISSTSSKATSPDKTILIQLNKTNK